MRKTPAFVSPLQLPAMLSLMSELIKSIVQRQGERLLRAKESDKTA